jgi:hypothetical protein
LSRPIRGVDSPNWDWLEQWFLTGHGDPNTVVPGRIGAQYRNLDGGLGATLWIKESDDGGDTGWVAK